MKIYALEKQNKKLNLYIEVYKKIKNRLTDIVKRIEIEEAKQYLDQYLIIPKSWYQKQEKDCEYYLQRLESKISTITTKIYYYGFDEEIED